MSLRARTLRHLREQLRSVARDGGLRERELQDFVCCLAEIAATDLKEAKSSLLDLSCDLDGIIHYKENE